jgi:hypothetical protein
MDMCSRAVKRSEKSGGKFSLHSNHKFHTYRIYRK